MIQKPTYLASKNAEPFQDKSVVQAYRHRPPYPAEVFDILAGLTNAEPRHVLDVGCGTSNIARNLVERVEWLDAVDVSQQMIEYGKQLPNGNHPRLRWLQGRVEDVELHPPYALVTAGESLHWMDWNIVLPRFHEVLTKGGYLAIVKHETMPDPWSTLGEIIARYRTDAAGYRPYDMIEAFEQYGLFQKVGERMTASVPFVQSIDDYIESYHSRSGFSRERMGSAQTAAFDQEARNILLKSHSDGMIIFQVTGSIVWGFPRGR
jgi:trans-aconitate methyltransferase